MDLFYAVLLRHVVIGWKRLIGTDVHDYIGSLGAFVRDGSAFNVLGTLHAVALHRTIVAVRSPIFVKSGEGVGFGGLPDLIGLLGVPGDNLAEKLAHSSFFSVVHERVPEVTWKRRDKNSNGDDDSHGRVEIAPDF